MNFLKDKLSKVKIPSPVFFVIAIIIILIFIPRASKFRYIYAENKPWTYGLLTAPFDFHIQKSESQVKKEQDSIANSMQPYYIDSVDVEKKMTTLFKQDAEAKSIPNVYIDYVTKKLGEVYKAGIISAEDYNKVFSTDKKQLWIRNGNNIAVTRHISSFYTPRQAYERIIEAHSIEMGQLNLDNYLKENIIFDEETSGKVKNELLQEVVLYNGMVQAGEKIIDRGEIVDSRTMEILDSYTKEVSEHGGTTKSKPGWLILGQLIMVSVLIMSLMLYLLFFRIKEYRNRKSVVFILSLVVLFSIITALVANSKSYTLLYVIPFAIPTILIRTFVDSRSSMVVHTIIIMICALMVPSPAEFIMIQVIIGYVCIFSLKNLSERSQLIFCTILILLGYIVTYTGWVLCFGGDVSQINWRMYMCFGINFIFVSFSYLLVYICEKMFGFISEVSMIELSNINRPLLQRLSEETPGTFQHSMQVSNLVTAAATQIGANATLARTGALYHDIGKMDKPAFFTENQSPGMNPHAGLSYKESAQIIISHVLEGVKIAKKYNLPQQIIDFIETHHGRGKAKYFYTMYKNEHPDEEVDEEDFTYPGPNPFTKETGLLMMADTVEAASRSLKEYTKESISEMVNKLIDGQVSEGFFKNTPLTFKDIETAKSVFCDKLEKIYHSRIAYPELKTVDETKDGDNK